MPLRPRNARCSQYGEAAASALVLTRSGKGSADGDGVVVGSTKLSCESVAAILTAKGVIEQQELLGGKTLSADIGIKVKLIEQLCGIVPYLRERFAKRFAAGGKEL